MRMKKNNLKEYEKFYKWAYDNSNKQIVDQYFPQINKNISSYYEAPIEICPYCFEYSYDSLEEFSKELNKMWEDNSQMKEILTAVLVAIFKNQPQNNITAEEIKENPTKTELTSFIYNF